MAAETESWFTLACFQVVVTEDLARLISAEFPEFFPKFIQHLGQEIHNFCYASGTTDILNINFEWLALQTIGMFFAMLNHELPEETYTKYCLTLSKCMTINYVLKLTGTEQDRNVYMLILVVDKLPDAITSDTDMILRHTLHRMSFELQPNTLH
jgi:hypothetical protein